MEKPQEIPARKVNPNEGCWHAYRVEFKDRFDNYWWLLSGPDTLDEALSIYTAARRDRTYGGRHMRVLFTATPYAENAVYTVLCTRAPNT